MNVAYRMIYLRVNSRGYSSGWANDAERDAFKSESRCIFQDMGWTLCEGKNGTCDTVTKGHQNLYLYPGSFSRAPSGDGSAGRSFSARYGQASRCHLRLVHQAELPMHWGLGGISH